MDIKMKLVTENADDILYINYGDYLQPEEDSLDNYDADEEEPEKQESAPKDTEEESEVEDDEDTINDKDNISQFNQELHEFSQQEKLILKNSHT